MSTEMRYGQWMIRPFGRCSVRAEHPKWGGIVALWTGQYTVRVFCLDPSTQQHLTTALEQRLHLALTRRFGSSVPRLTGACREIWHGMCAANTPATAAYVPCRCFCHQPHPSESIQ